MSDLENELRAEREIISRATAGPWLEVDEEGQRYLCPPSTGAHLIDYGVDRDQQTRDATFTAHARTALPLRSAQVEAVLSIHRPVEVEPSATICSGCSTRRGTFPDFRYFPVVEYPCETVRAIEEAGA